MDIEKRKTLRRSFHHDALIIGPEKPLITPCAIFDISDAGAQLELAATDEIPDQIILVLSKGGKVKRQCSVVWRDKNRIGVEFHQPMTSAG